MVTLSAAARKAKSRRQNPSGELALQYRRWLERQAGTDRAPSTSSIKRYAAGFGRAPIDVVKEVNVVKSKAGRAPLRLTAEYSILLHKYPASGGESAGPAAAGSSQAGAPRAAASGAGGGGGYESDGSAGEPEVDPRTSQRAPLTIANIANMTWLISLALPNAKRTAGTPAVVYKDAKQVEETVKHLRGAMRFLAGSQASGFKDDTPIDEWLKKIFADQIRASSNGRISFKDHVLEPLKNPPANWPIQVALGTRKNYLAGLSKLFQLSPVGPVAPLFQETSAEISTMVTSLRNRTNEGRVEKKKGAAIPVGKRYEDLVAKQRVLTAESKADWSKEDWFKYLLITHKVEIPSLRGDEAALFVVDDRETGDEFRSRVDSAVNFVTRDTGEISIESSSKREQKIEGLRLGPITRSIFRYIESKYGEQSYFLGRARPQGYVKKMTGLKSPEIRHGWVTHKRKTGASVEELHELARLMGHDMKTQEQEYYFSDTVIDDPNPRLGVFKPPSAKQPRSSRAGGADPKKRRLG